MKNKLTVIAFCCLCVSAGLVIHLFGIKPAFAQSRPIVAQNYCTGTAAPGQMFVQVALAPPGTAGTQVGLGPFRCVSVDPTAFKLDSTGGVLQLVPAAPPPPPPLIGGPCTAPPVGSVPTVYAKASDGSCLPLIGIPPPGSIASSMTTEQFGEVVAGAPVQVFYEFLIVGLTPTPGSNLCPAPDGLKFQLCQPGQTPP